MYFYLDNESDKHFQDLKLPLTFLEVCLLPPEVSLYPPPPEGFAFLDLESLFTCKEPYNIDEEQSKNREEYTLSSLTIKTFSFR